jgi:hypothetical protein
MDLCVKNNQLGILHSSVRMFTAATLFTETKYSISWNEEGFATFLHGCFCELLFTVLLDLALYDLFIFLELNNSYVLLQYCCVESAHIAKHCYNSFDMWACLLDNFSFLG